MSGIFSELGGALGDLGGGIAVLAGAGGRSGTREFKQALDVLQRLEADPGFDLSSIPPAQLQVFSEYFPEVYQAVVPESVQMAQDSELGRGAQSRSLATLEDIRDSGGLTTADRMGLNQAGRRISGEMAAGNDAITRDLAQRGRLTGGDAIAARSAGNQSAMDLANQMGTSIGMEAANRRMAAAQAAAGLGANIRAGDTDLSKWNADAANRFNEMRSGRQNEAAQYAAAVRNAAGQKRSDTRQRVGESNALMANEGAWKNRLNQNSLRQQVADNAWRKAAGISGAYRNLGQQRNLDKAVSDQQIMGMGQAAGTTAGLIADLGFGTGGAGGGKQGQGQGGMPPGWWYYGG
jgi:hypothetical protein